MLSVLNWYRPKDQVCFEYYNGEMKTYWISHHVGFDDCVLISRKFKV